jgi:hypothetical protein
MPHPIQSQPTDLEQARKARAAGWKVDYPKDPIPPGRYEVTVIDDTTVEIAEGPCAGRRIKASMVPADVRRAVVDVDVREVE